MRYLAMTSPLVYVRFQLQLPVEQAVVAKLHGLLSLPLASIGSSCRNSNHQLPFGSSRHWVTTCKPVEQPWMNLVLEHSRNASFLLWQPLVRKCACTGQQCLSSLVLLDLLVGLQYPRSYSWSHPRTHCEWYLVLVSDLFQRPSFGDQYSRKGT